MHPIPQARCARTKAAMNCPRRWLRRCGDRAGAGGGPPPPPRRLQPCRPRRRLPRRRGGCGAVPAAPRVAVMLGERWQARAGYSKLADRNARAVRAGGETLQRFRPGGDASLPVRGPVWALAQSAAYNHARGEQRLRSSHTGSSSTPAQGLQEGKTKAPSANRIIVRSSNTISVPLASAPMGLRSSRTLRSICARSQMLVLPKPSMSCGRPAVCDGCEWTHAEARALLFTCSSAGCGS